MSVLEMPRWKRAPSPSLGLVGGKKGIPDSKRLLYLVSTMSDLHLCFFFLVPATFYLVPEGLLTVRELLRGRPCFWAHFSPKWVHHAVALYRSRFQPDLPTEEGSESSMDWLIPYSDEERQVKASQGQASYVG